MLDSCDFIGDRYSYTRVDVNIVLTADFSWSYIAFVGWVGSVCTLPWVGFGWVCSSVGWVGLKKMDPCPSLLVTILSKCFVSYFNSQPFY